jgi:lysophospholipase
MQPAAALFAPFFLTSPGARLRAARFVPDGAPRGTVVLLTGQSEFIEKYFEVIDDLRRRGLAVAICDWRGQGGSERPIAEDPMKIWIADFKEYDADLDTLFEQAVRPMLRPGEKPIALAHSMGGHVLMRGLARASERFAAAIFSAPMMAIRMPVPDVVPRFLSTLMARRRAKIYAWGIAGRDPLKLPFSKQIVTSDPDRYARTQAILAAHPQLRVAGPTWGWLAAATRSMAAMLKPGVPEAITTPVLVCDAGNDLVCKSAVSAHFTRRIPGAQHLLIDGARHEILMERDVYREQFWTALDAFLHEKCPGL